MNWKIEQAQQQLPQLINDAIDEPQLIYNQDQLVAAVVEPEIFQEFLVWKDQHHQRSLAYVFAELRQICVEEDYSLEVPPCEEAKPNLP
ncbi:MAG: prevent-host-death protein [Scytonema sp. PMC 1069.18]|nr:prevent-host-death protein [Scytonema sp. PMC 1069.18]MEC4886032.1 prevent-host-death protein [Scytonema sp. PMC 1070.18]